MTADTEFVPCTDTRCHHDAHCPEAHRRKAHALSALLTGAKMDSGGLVRGVCSCGNYRTPIGTPRQVRIAHGHHAAAKIEAHARELPCVGCPAAVLDAVLRRRAAADTAAAEWQ